MSQAGFTPIQLYFSTTAAATPSAGNLANGELAINITDGRLFYKDNGGVVKLLASNAGSAGDVVGPGSSTDNALVRFDGTTGKLVQNSVGVLSDAGVLTGLSGLTSSGSITFSSLTSGRVPYATTAGLLTDSANLAFDGTTLTANALTVTNAVTLSGGTANGVAYLNGSKVLTTGSALTFDGSRIALGTATSNIQLTTTVNTNQAYISLADADGRTAVFRGPNSGAPNCAQIGTTTNHDLAFLYGNAEQMRLTSTGLGIGTSSPSRKLEVNGIFRQTDGAVQAEIASGGSVAYYGTNNNYPVAIQVNAVERARFDTSGNLGIGTSSPAYKLDVNGTTRLGAGSAAILAGVGGAFVGGQGELYTISTNNMGIGTTGAASLRMYTNSVLAATLDSSGNLGLGVTPSADWSATGVLVSPGVFAGTSGATRVMSNVRFSGALAGGPAYNSNGTAEQYLQNAGAHVWYTAPSGTAGNAISFTQAMTLDASGYLVVGDTITSARFKAALTGASTASITTVSDFGAAGVLSLGGVGNNNQGVYLGTGDARTGTNSGIAAGIGFLREASGWNSALAFYTNGTTDGSTTNRITERARIDSSGNFLVGTTTTDIWIGSATNTGISLGPSGTATFSRSGFASLLVKRVTSTGNLVEFGYGTTYLGQIATNGTTVSYETSSDYRLKNTIAPMTGALAKVALLKPCTYKWNADGSDGEGFIAHELAEVVPQCVTGEKDAVDAEGNPRYQGIDTSFLVATLTAAIQEQQALIQTLTARVAALESN